MNTYTSTLFIAILLILSSLQSVSALRKNFSTTKGCIPVGQSGCEGNNGRCCRVGDPYTGSMRRCVNKGSFSSPNYVCEDF